MKLFYTIVIAGLLTLSACNRSDRDRVRASNERATQDQLKQQRDDYVRAVDAKLAEFDQKFDGLDARANGMSDAATRDFKSAVDGLRDQRKAVGKKLDDLKGVSVDSWMSLKGEVDNALGGLERSYEKVSASNETVPAAAPKKY